ncbi:MAG: hypothetical protein ACE5GT_11100 [Rhodospirillales bacterium]
MWFLVAAAPLPAAAAEEGESRVFDLKIENRVLAAGNKVIRVTEGDRVELRWRTDEAVELHLHGYDVKAAVEPGATAVMGFTAHATGRFPVTSHGFRATGGKAGHAHGHGKGHKILMYLEVYPR